MKKPVRKKKVSTENQPRKETLVGRLPKDRGEWLKLVIKLTNHAINPEYPDKGMVDQKVRLETELAKWKAANSR